MLFQLDEESQMELSNKEKIPPMTQEERVESATRLAASLLLEGLRDQTPKERMQQRQLAGLLKDPKGMALSIGLTDQCFRSSCNRRVADQIHYLLQKLGIPRYLSSMKQGGLITLKWFAKWLPSFFIPLTRKMIRKQTRQVILPGENEQLIAHIKERRREGVRINLNRLGEAILGEEEALRRLQIYLDDLSCPDVEYISIKISTICSQIQLLAWDETLRILSDRFRQLLRVAHRHYYKKPCGTEHPKFINLDMEEYCDLNLTVALFCQVLDEPEFLHASAGIVLQAYLPDSYDIQKELTKWAQKRREKGGAPIKVRIVKGANLAMEQSHSSLHGWPQAPYPTKEEVDANFKRMVSYGCEPIRARAVHLGVASHNLFDISYALLLIGEKGVENEVEFEMLEGMADHLRRALQKKTKEMLLYCPAAKEEDFQNALAYLMRRLDENTAPQNFLRHLFSLKPDTQEWREQAALFHSGCALMEDVSSKPRRRQNRNEAPAFLSLSYPFENEPDTDWVLPHNRNWINTHMKQAYQAGLKEIPLVIGGREVWGQKIAGGFDPSRPHTTPYRYCLAGRVDLEEALQTACKVKEAFNPSKIASYREVLSLAAHLFSANRGELIAAMVEDAGKIVEEADREVSEAIDFLRYYARSIHLFTSFADVHASPKGVAFITPPWNFSCAIPTGGIAAAIVAGNAVLFKPARETVRVGWLVANLLWKAGIDKNVLQFIPCMDTPEGSSLLKDPRVDFVILTGATASARRFLQMRPGLDLVAETGGKNTMIVTDMSDRDLAVKDIIHSAFSYAGQKCSALSLLILEKKVYRDDRFLQQLRDAAQSLHCGSAWDYATRVNPLIHPPGKELMRGLTTLEGREEWLLKPSEDPVNPRSWTPGIKLGVMEGSFMHQTELFGPLLAVLRADDLDHAIHIASSTPYGLTAGLHSLDEREHREWLERMRAGNYYINRTITGSIVRRQPFGGCKESSFGLGCKAGGPNYLRQMMRFTQVRGPRHRSGSRPLFDEIKESGLEDPALWDQSIGSYCHAYESEFSKKRDPSLLIGQDNFFYYVPHEKMYLRLQQSDLSIHILLTIAACELCGTKMEISGCNVRNIVKALWYPKCLYVSVREESEELFQRRLAEVRTPRVRLLSPPTVQLQSALAEIGANSLSDPLLSNGRIELLHYMREVSVSDNYHRYGNLGERENEQRRPLRCPGKI